MSSEGRLTGDSMELTFLSVGSYDNIAYVLGCVSTREAVIIDAAAEPGRILEETAGWNVTQILTTHGHFDHLGALDGVISELHVPWSMHLADVPIAGRSPDLPLTHGQSIEVGRIQVQVVHTPGHTPGSVCFLAQPWLWSGDTLFPGGPGATRWEYSSFDLIMKSLDEHLFVLPDETLVLPGHGEATTIGRERTDVEVWRRRGW